MVKSSDSCKLYRCPPTPPPTYMYNRERSFILDGVAVSTISKDYSNCNPKLGTIIPPYNGQKDKNAANYFKFQGIRNVLHRSGQSPPGTPIEGVVEELFFTKGTGFRYLSRRNLWGCGRSHDMMSGHAGMFDSIKPIIGYNGESGLRRNTPSLRRLPSSFGKPVFYAPMSARPANDSARKSTRSSRSERRAASDWEAVKSERQTQDDAEKSSKPTANNNKKQNAEPAEKSEKAESEKDASRRTSQAKAASEKNADD